MARARSSGNGRLEEAMTALQQSQAALQQSQAILTQSMTQFLQDHAQDMRRIDERHAADMRRIDERFTRIEATLAEVLDLLHSLPDAVHHKFDFRPPQSNTRRPQWIGRLSWRKPTIALPF